MSEAVSFVLPVQDNTEELKFQKNKGESFAIQCVHPIENENNFIHSSPIKQSNRVGFVLLTQANTTETKSSENKDESSTTQSTQSMGSGRNYSRYQPFGYNKKKEYNPDIYKCGVIHLHKSQIIQLETQECFKQDSPILTLSMAKILTISALSKDLYSICSAINTIGYYMKQNWKAYKSHRKKQLELIRSRSSS